MINADDILKNLRDRGIDPGAWQSRPEGKLNLLLLQKQMEMEKLKQDEQAKAKEM
jgi:hypothetical protein